MVNITIVQMARHFLYLPLYYAHSADFFGFLPPGYKVDVVDAPKKTDVSAYEFLLRSMAEFAVCDPTVLLAKPAPDANPRLLAGLVTNAAFWAIDHKSHPVADLRDLGAFQSIIAFEPGTTSYGIAARVLRESGSSTLIRAVDPNQELVALTKSQPGSAVALSPNILEIEHLLEHSSGSYGVDLALAKTVEYGSVLVTALLTRADVIKAHGPFVRALLSALQRAMTHIVLERPSVIEYAHRALNKPEEIVRRALRSANGAQVYPLTLRVSDVHWLSAARAYADASGGVFDDRAAEIARETFRRCVEPNATIVRELVEEQLLKGIGEAPEDGSRDTGVLATLRPRAWLFVTAAAAVAGTLAGGFVSWNLVLLATFALLAFAPLCLGVPLSRGSASAHGILSLLTIASTAAWLTDQVSTAAFASVTVTAAVADLVLVASEARR